MADKQVAVRFKADGGVQLRQELRGIGSDADRAFDQMERGAARGGGAWQNVGFQVQDFAVQVASGTDATRALAQQLPQLLSGFGLLGVVVGTAAAVIFPLASYFLSTGEAAAQAASEVDRLTASVDELRKINDNFSTEGVQRLIDKYGELDAKVMLLLERQRQMAENAAMDQARSVTQSFGAEFQGMFAYLDEYESRRQQIMQGAGVTAQEAEGFAAMTEVAAFLNAEFGVTVQRAQEIQAALAAVTSANSIPEMADALATLTGLLEGSALAGSDLNQQLLSAEDAMRQLNAEGAGIGGWLGSAIDWAAGLAKNLWEGAAAASAIRSGAASAGPGARSGLAGGRSAGTGGPALDPYGFRDQLRRDDLVNSVVRPPARGGGGGGGGGGANNERLAMEREAARIYEETRTEAEKYATELQRLNELQAGGFITADTYNRALEDMARTTGDLSAEMQQVQNSFRDAFGDIVTGSKSAKEALSDLFGSLARQLANKAFDGLWGLLGGGLFGGLFGGGKVKAFASGGIVKGPTVFPMADGAGLMGEAGPEAIMPLTRIGGKLGVRAAGLGGGSGGVVLNIDARGAQAGVAEQIAAVLELRMPDIERRAVAAVSRDRARGRIA